MGRHPVADRDEALDRVLTRFWSHGFAATSMEDLLAATGMHKGSFYRSFGSKRAAFDAAFGRYVAQVTATDVVPALTAPGPALARLEQLVTDRLNSALRPGDEHRSGPRGCLVVNTATELAAHDGDSASQIRDALDALSGVMAALIGEAVANEEIDASLDIDGAAAHLVALLQGLIVLGRAGYDPDLLRRRSLDGIRIALSTSPGGTPT